METPVAWFANPKLSEPTPLTFTEEGRVYGHLALWDTCHTGYPGECVRPPHSPSAYRWYHVGRYASTRLAMQVGKITFHSGHASLDSNYAEAIRHYDDTSTVAAYVRAGEDEIGPWLAGAARRGLSEEQLEEINGACPSGDWRWVDGGLDLSHVLLVNVPGYPVPSARVASIAGRHQTVAMVAAGAFAPPSREPLVLPMEMRMRALHARVR